MDSIEYTVFKLIKILNKYGYLYARRMHSDNKLMGQKAIFILGTETGNKWEYEFTHSSVV